MALMAFMVIMVVPLPPIAMDMLLADEDGTVSAVDGTSVTMDYKKAGTVEHRLFK